MSKKLELYYDNNFNGTLGHLNTGNNKSIHKFLNTSFKNYKDGENNITVSKLIVYITQQ